MFIDVQGHHITITEPIKNYVMEKLARLNTHNHNIMNITVLLKLEKDSHTDKHTAHKAEGTVKFKGKKEVFAHSITEDMYAAIDGLVDKLDEMVKKQKERHQSHGDGEAF